MGKYFGTDGFRGEANCNLTADHAYKVGRFLGWYYGELKRRNNDTTKPKIVIGKDTRLSSYMFEYSLVGGLVASGADAYLLHVTTTPSVAYIARVDNFDCGIMISASHNPYYDNGIKLINRHGEKMDEETIGYVEQYLDGCLEIFDNKYTDIPFAHKDDIGRTVDYVSGRNRYIGYLISLGVYSFRGIKVGLDCANGASWNVAKSVFDALGAETYVINNLPNGTNINNNCGSTHIEGLQKFVVDNKLDVGFAYDGDADRCLAVDEKGNVITGDHMERFTFAIEQDARVLMSVPCIFYGRRVDRSWFNERSVGTHIQLTGTLAEILGPANFTYSSLLPNMFASNFTFNARLYVKNGEITGQKMAQEEVLRYIANTRKIAAWRVIKGNRIEK